MLRVPKILKKFIMVSPLWLNSFHIFVVALQKHFVYDWSLKVKILAQNWPTAKSLWHCSLRLVFTSDGVVVEVAIRGVWLSRLWSSENCIAGVASRSGRINQWQCSIPSLVHDSSHYLSFFQLASGRNSTNSAIDLIGSCLVPGAGGIFSSGILQLTAGDILQVN